MRRYKQYDCTESASPWSISEGILYTNVKLMKFDKMDMVIYGAIEGMLCNTIQYVGVPDSEYEYHYYIGDALPIHLYKGMSIETLSEIMIQVIELLTDVDDISLFKNISKHGIFICRDGVSLIPSCFVNPSSDIFNVNILPPETIAKCNNADDIMVNSIMWRVAAIAYMYMYPDEEFSLMVRSCSSAFAALVQLFDMFGIPSIDTVMTYDEQFAKMCCNQTYRVQPRKKCDNSVLQLIFDKSLLVDPIQRLEPLDLLYDICKTPGSMRYIVIWTVDSHNKFPDECQHEIKTICLMNSRRLLIDDELLFCIFGYTYAFSNRM